MSNRYPEYKDSGFEWLGEIPAAWNNLPLSVLFKREKKLSDGTGELLSVYREYGVIPKSSRNDNHNVESEDLSKYQVVKTGSLVVNKMKAWQGSMAVSEYDGIVSPAYYVYNLRKKWENLDIRFINLLVRCNHYIPHYGNISKGVRIGQWDLDPKFFEKTPILLPPLETQHRIVEFLDRETASIDTQVNELESLVTLLTERRKALISETVTRGIPGEHAEFKESGVEWLREIPSDWNVTKTQDFFSERRERNDLGQEANYLSLVAGKGIMPYAEKGNMGNKMPEDLSKTKKIFKRDFVINSMNYGIGSFGDSRYDGVCSSVYVVLTPKSEVYDKFAYLLLSNPDVAKYAQSFGKGILAHRAAIGWDTLKNIKMPLPPLDVQRRIVDFLDHEISHIDTLASEAKGAIALLKEKRKVLISDVVTGKVMVE